MHLFTIPPWIHFLWLTIVAGVVLWKGGWRERAILAVLWATTLFNFSVCRMPHHWAGPLPTCNSIRAFAEAFIMLAVCVAALRGARRYWVLWFTSVTLASLFTDVLGQFHRAISLWAYLSAQVIWFYLLAVILLVGAFTSARDRAAARTAAALG